MSISIVQVTGTRFKKGEEVDSAYDFDFQYDGVIDLLKLSGILKGVKDDPSIS